MKLVVFGATGGTGQHILTQALQAGHSVTAVARDPSQLAITHDQLHTVPGDVLDPATLLGCTDGADAVLSALGVGTSRSPTSVYSAGITNILHPMRQAAVRRILVISALPVTPRTEVGLVQRWVAYPILYQLFGDGYADMARMEQLLHDSDTDWTIIRPPRLTNAPATGHYRTAVNEQLRRAGKISRAELAGAMLDLMQNPDAVRATVIAAQ